MSEKEAKKLRKATRYNARIYLRSFKNWPFWNRVGLAWWFVFGDKRKA